MLNHQFNPMDKIVSDIDRNKNLLTAEHIAYFRKLCGASPTAPQEFSVNEKSSISNLLGALNRIAENLKARAEGNMDVEEFKNLIGSIEKVMAMINKYSDQVSHEEKVKALQDSIYETLQELEDKSVVDDFLMRWQTRINCLK